MVRETVNRKYKDGIFRSLFNDKEKLIELYNALSDSNYTADTPVKIVTLDNVIFTGIKNDIAFVIEDRFIVLTEHQSTLSPIFRSDCSAIWPENMKNSAIQMQCIAKGR